MSRGSPWKALPAQKRIAAHTVLWAAGVAASPLGRMLAGKTGVQSDRLGRVMVNPDLSMPGHPEIFVIGDMAHLPGKDGNPLPGLAPVATQQGRYVARGIEKRLSGEKPATPFSYFDKGTMAVIGKHAAVANIGRFRFGGITAWLMWLFIHLLLLINFESRLVVLRPLGLFVLHPQPRLKGADRDGHPAPAHHGRREDAGTMISRH